MGRMAWFSYSVSLLLCAITFYAGCQIERWAAGKALQGPAIKQKLILTCTARGEAAAVRGKLDQTYPFIIRQ